LVDAFLQLDLTDGLSTLARALERETGVTAPTLR
jgi:hypothetical protein